MGAQPRTRASDVEANSSRTNVQAPVYVAGFERGVRPIALWSISIARPRYSVPEKEEQLKIFAVLCFP